MSFSHLPKAWVPSAQKAARACARANKGIRKNMAWRFMGRIVEKSEPLRNAFPFKTHSVSCSGAVVPISSCHLALVRAKVRLAHRAATGRLAGDSVRRAHVDCRTYWQRQNVGRLIRRARPFVY